VAQRDNTKIQELEDQLAEMQEKLNLLLK
jgi:hypothetical protein